MAVQRLTDYTRRIWTALDADAPEGHDFEVGDVIYYMDSSQCGIVTYVYPEGSIDVEFLPDIGGGGGGYTADDWLDLNKPEGKVESGATTLYANELRSRTNITEIVLTAATDIPDSFARDCTGLTSVSLPQTVTAIRAGAFQGASKLGGSIFVPNVGLATSCFENTRISTIVCAGVGLSQSYALRYNPSLLAVDYVAAATHTGNQTFISCRSFKTFICRRSGVVALPGVNCFTETPFASGKAGGTLYVPQALIESYQNATNWSTILAYPNNRILPIEGSIYETQYADGTPIP